MSDTWNPSDEQMRDLEALLGVLIPRGEDGRLPGADEVGVAAAIGAAARADSGFAEALLNGLAALAAAAGEAGASSFAALSEAHRLAALTALDEAHPDFVRGLLFPTYQAYYASPRVARALGLEAWPPHPQGFPLETGDLSLLDPVRARGPRFREA